MTKQAENGTPKIAIVGAGQLGSRYLQGLAQCPAPLRIWVMDPQPTSLSLARQRWEKAGGQHTAHTVHWRDAITQLPQALDLALVTTNADAREAVVRTLAAHAHVRYWVLEKVLAQSVDALDTLLHLTASAAGRWVNTSRRMMAWHQQLYGVLSPGQPLRVRGGDSLWGLACNTVHFLDLIAWWSDAALVEVDTSGLDAVWRESKRPGFFEVTGTLEAVYANGSTLTLESRPEGRAFSLQVETAQGLWTIDEAAGLGTGPEGQRLSGRLEFQSEMTSRLVTSILETGRCALPTLEASVETHRPFLQSMLDHWNRSGQRNDPRVPVT